MPCTDVPTRKLRSFASLRMTTARFVLTLPVRARRQATNSFYMFRIVRAHDFSFARTEIVFNISSPFTIETN
jgi:hypothetical protein